MIRSMTGYARAESETPWGLATWELRSVNHRYLDVSMRLPESIRPREHHLRQAISEFMKRGKLEANLRLRGSDASAEPIEVDGERVAAIAAALEDVAARMPDAPLPDRLSVLAWPGVIRSGDPDPDALHSSCAELLKTALGELDVSRRREGERLATVLDNACSQLLEHVDAVEGRLPQVQTDWRGRLDARLAELGDPPDPGRIEQEMLLMAQKMDVAEEMQRLRSHVTEIRAILAKDGSVGRRLEFFLQECNREANTLASKSQDAELTRHAVEMKVVVEQMREQVQNIE